MVATKTKSSAVKLKPFMSSEMARAQEIIKRLLEHLVIIRNTTESLDYQDDWSDARISDVKSSALNTVRDQAYAALHIGSNCAMCEENLAVCHCPAKILRS